MVQVENVSVSAPRHPEFPFRGCVKAKESLPCCDDLPGLRGVIPVLFRSNLTVAILRLPLNPLLLRIWDMGVMDHVTIRDHQPPRNMMK